MIILKLILISLGIAFALLGVITFVACIAIYLQRRSAHGFRMRRDVEGMTP